MTSDDRERQADQASAAGNLPEAEQLMHALAIDHPSPARFFKLASLRTAMGRLQPALLAVEQGLALRPLDFIGLLSRATILERLGVEGFGEAYGRALAQLPAGEVPPSLSRAIVHGRQAYDAYISERDNRLRASLALSLETASEEETRRIDRFRTNALRKTRVFHSEPSHFHFPGLREREFHDQRDFPWIQELTELWPEILAEYQAATQAADAERVPYIQYAEHEPLRQWADLNNNLAWTALHLSQYGKAITANAEKCPKTFAFLDRVDQPQIPGCSPNAVFSVLAPDTHIPPHTGVTNTRLLCHLPLIVPEGCWFRVGAETRYWQPGCPFVFDDTIEHEARNPTSELRAVLIFDVWHPDLSLAEREAVTALLQAEAHGASLAL
jgi:aspartyl/asparaginyl beta-hydroxylase (cupin superfamily)